MPRTIGLLLGAITALLACTTAQAGDMYPWRSHAKPFTFVFGNDFDTHQQTQLRPDGSLWGFFYVRYTGVVTKDGLPVATHVNCNEVPDRCVVGWMIEGKPAHAMFSHQPMHDHPMFTMPRAGIPQPGSYSHFHWTGAAMPHHLAAGYALQLTAKNRFCFIHHGADGASSAAGCQESGGVGVEPGIDLATHSNIIPVSQHGS